MRRFMVLLLLVSCAPVEGGDSSSQLACERFHEIADDVAAGVLTKAEIREGLQAVYDHAQSSESTAIQNAATDMLAAITADDLDRFDIAVGRMGDACATVEPL